MKFGTSYLPQGAAIAALILCVNGGNAATSDPTWPAKWPSSVADNTKLQQELVETDYTAEERRNILTILNEASDEARVAWLRDPKRAPHEGFPGLDKYYGAPGYDEATSIPDRKDRILDILAKDNRVFGVYTISGHHQGPMWGWKGDGKPLEILAFFYRTFDPQGRTTENYFHTEELQLYVALGGKVEFPKDGIAAQLAEAPKPGTPFAPRARPAPAAELTTWPPAQWPAGVASPKLKQWLTEAHWTEEEKQVLYKALQANQFVAPDYNSPMDFTVAPFCGISCPNGRRGFDYLDYLSGIHGYNPARSVRDRVVETGDIIAKGKRVIRVFSGRGHQTGYFYGFPGDGHAIEWTEIGSGNSGAGLRAEELQLYVAMGGKLQFPGKSPSL
jgi:hypothetical protein